jgi:ubiquitin-conjugating enzyme E2 O
MKRILRDVTVLPTSLLPQQQIRVFTYEDRMDALRFLVVAPSDTPYADVPFVFDVALPSDYPASPPNMVFHATVGEKLHPNLSTNGTVCLSLLGTWHAASDCESWNPAVSTLLQLIVSTQALLFVQEPYYLEAGYERFRGTEMGRIKSTEYNETAYMLSLRHYVAMYQRRSTYEPPVAAALERHYEESAARVVARARSANMSQGAVMMLQRDILPMLETTFAAFLRS